MNDKTRTNLQMIQEIVRQETIFLRHFVGVVLDNKDELNKGRIQVAIYDLGLDTKDVAPWCNARYIGNGISIPKVDDWVEVYFINGSPDRPVWLALASEVKDNLLSNFVDEKTDVLHENRVTGDAIIYKEEDEQYQIGAGSESFVKGDTAQTEMNKDNSALQQLQTDLTAWTPFPADGGAALKAILSAGFLTSALGSYSNILSDKIKGE